MRKPRVIVKCVADHYTAPGERIIEFSFSDGTGGLISLQQPTGAGGRRGRVEVYRTDGQVLVIAPEDETKRQFSVDSGGLDLRGGLAAC